MRGGEEMARSIEALIEAFQRQAAACTRLGSPWTAAVLACLADDLQDHGPTAALLHDWTLPPVPSAVALRLAGALNALVLDGRSPELAALHPVGRRPAPDAAAVPIDSARRGPLFEATRGTVAAHPGFIADFIRHAVQTNEVQRSAVLAPGLLEVAARTGAPLRLREIGASGGLNLLADRWCYRLGALRWGDAGSMVRLTPHWQGPEPALPMDFRILERRGVDIHPLDFRDDAVVRRGLAYIWPDQAARVANFRAAVRALRASPVRVEAGDAAHWLPTVLDPRDGVATVVFHSIMWQYMPPATRTAVEAAIRSAGATATTAAPLAWLRYEPLRDGDAFELTLDLFAGPERPPRERLAWVHPHGASVHWLAPDDPQKRVAP